MVFVYSKGLQYKHWWEAPMQSGRPSFTNGSKWRAMCTQYENFTFPLLPKQEPSLRNKFLPLASPLTSVDFRSSLQIIIIPVCDTERRLKQSHIHSACTYLFSDITHYYCIDPCTRSPVLWEVSDPYIRLLLDAIFPEPF